MAASALHLSYKTLISGIGTVNSSNPDYSNFPNTFTVSGNVMRVLLILPILVLAYSCKSKSTRQNASTISSINSSDTVIVDTSSYTWKGNFKTLGQQRLQKGYSVVGLPLCDDSKGKFLDDAKLEKYGYYTPYDVQKTEMADSLKVTFDFIANCCLNFTGDINSKGDTLSLTYFIKEGNGGACDCSCDYRMIYVVKKQTTAFRVIKIRRG
jgi:hypothetical protein